MTQPLIGDTNDSYPFIQPRIQPFQNIPDILQWMCLRLFHFKVIECFYQVAIFQSEFHIPEFSRLIVVGITDRI